MPLWALLELTPSSELTEWLAYSEVEPFGSLVEDLRAGLAPAVTINVNRAPDSDAKTFGPLDFYPWHKAAEPSSSEALPAFDPQNPQVSAMRMIYALSSPG